MKIIVKTEEFLDLLDKAGLTSDVKKRLVGLLLEAANSQEARETINKMVEDTIKRTIDQAMATDWWGEAKGWGMQALQSALRQTIRQIDLDRLIQQKVDEAVAIALRKNIEQEVQKYLTQERLERLSLQTERDVEKIIERVVTRKLGEVLRPLAQ